MRVWGTLLRLPNGSRYFGILTARYLGSRKKVTSWKVLFRSLPRTETKLRRGRRDRIRVATFGFLQCCPLDVIKCSISRGRISRIEYFVFSELRISDATQSTGIQSAWNRPVRFGPLLGRTNIEEFGIFTRFLLFPHRLASRYFPSCIFRVFFCTSSFR